MDETARRVAVLGVTGSIGRNVCDVIRASEGRLQLAAATAHARVEELAGVAAEFRPSLIAVSDEAAGRNYDWSGLPHSVRTELGKQGLVAAATLDDVDVVAAAVVGSAGLPAVLAAVQAGKRLALANKETLVAAGSVVTGAAAKSGAEIIPVDSEHSAIFQCLAGGRREEVERIVLTASGGPFRCWTAEQLAAATPEQALRHPTWSMAPRSRSTRPP